MAQQRHRSKSLASEIFEHSRRKLEVGNFGDSEKRIIRIRKTSIFSGTARSVRKPFANMFSYDNFDKKVIIIDNVLLEPLFTGQAIHVGEYVDSPVERVRHLIEDEEKSDKEESNRPLFCELLELVLDDSDKRLVWKESARWIKYEETVEEGGTRFSKPHITLMNIQSVLQVRNSLRRGAVHLDVVIDSYKQLVETFVNSWTNRGDIKSSQVEIVRKVLLSRKFHLVKNRLRTASGKFLNDIVPPSESDELLQNSSSTCSIQQLSSSTPSSVFNQNILRKLPSECESAVIMVGHLNELDYPITQFVRLSSGVLLHPELPELPVPLRFLFVLLSPFDYYENEAKMIGKTMSSLIIDEVFKKIAYKAKEPYSLVDGVDEFISQMIIIPPGKWNPKFRWEPQDDMPQVIRMVTNQTQLTYDESKSEFEHDVPSGLRRTGRIFGGFINDIKRKWPWYWSDFGDFFRGRITQSLAATIFLFFANITKIITFGGVMENMLHAEMAAVENLLSGGICGVIYALFSGQPLTVLSATGPTLIFEAILYQFCSNQEWNYLPVRFWVGLWTALLLLILVAVDASALVSLITRFTEEAFATLISVIFIVQAFEELIEIGHQAPLIIDPQLLYDDPCVCNVSTVDDFTTTMTSFVYRNITKDRIADFGVFLAIVTMTGLACIVGLDVPHLHVPTKFHPTLDRGWLIDPTKIGHWSIAIVAFLPAIFLTILVVMDQQITAVIINREDNKLKKGYGYHLDLLVIASLMIVCASMGIPFYVAATVISIMHVDSLRVQSECTAPGERSQFLGVKEQRITALVAHILIGFSVFLTPIIKLVPMPVLLGIFLYMGVVSLIGQQFVQRTMILFMPMKHQPDYSWLRIVHLKRVHLFTTLQILCLVLLFVVKYTQRISMMFPIMLIAIVFVRMYLLERMFTMKELLALDDPLPSFPHVLQPEGRQTIENRCNYHMDQVSMTLLA